VSDAIYFGPMLSCHAGGVIATPNPHIGLQVGDKLWISPVARIASSLSTGLLGSAPRPTARVGATDLSYFSLLSFCFSMHFTYPVTSFLIPDALPFFLFSKYSLSFLTLTFLTHGVTQRKLLM
jgi:hypothetical protein